MAAPRATLGAHGGASERAMIIVLCVVAMLVAFALIWRGYDVRGVLFGTSLLIGALAGQPGAVFRRMAEALADTRFLLPICGAMAFAWVVRETGCVKELVALLLRPFARVRRLIVPGSGAVAFAVNTAIPSQTSTLAAVGPLSVAVMTRLDASALHAGTALVLGGSIAGELLNPGVAQVVAVAGYAKITPAELIVWFAPAAFAAFVTGMGALLLTHRVRGGGEASLRDSISPDVRRSMSDAEKPSPAWSFRALLPVLPVLWLLLSHPALPSHALVARVTPSGLEVFSAMLAGAVLTVAVGAKDRAAATRAMFDGMGFGFAHIVTLIAVSSGVAKALELAGVLHAFVGTASGHPSLALGVAFALAFLLAVLSGSGVGPAVALVTALAPQSRELGVDPLALGGVLLFGAEAGRTTSPVAAVVLFGGSLVSLPPRTLAGRLFVACLVGGGVGALVCVVRAW